MRTLNVLNKLFTTAIVFTMINLNIAINIEQARFNINSAQAYAQEESSSTAGSNDTPEVRSADGTVVLENTQESDTDSMTQKRQEMSGTYTKQESSVFLSIFGNEVVAAVILGTIAYIISKIWVGFKPSKPTDIYAAATGGGILLINELMSAFKQTESLKDRKEKIEYEGLGEDGQVDVSQKRLLEEEKAALEELKKTAESKAKFQLAGAAAFGIAAGIAAWKGNEQLSMAQMCAATANASFIAANELAVASAACVPSSSGVVEAGAAKCEIAAIKPAEIEALKVTPGDSAVQYPVLLKLLAAKEAAAGACAMTTESGAAKAIAECTAETAGTMGASSGQLAAVKSAAANLSTANALMLKNCKTYILTNTLESGMLSPEQLVSSHETNTNYYVRLLSLLINKANASSFGGSLGILIGLIGAYIQPTGSYMSLFMLSSVKRGWLWLGFSGVALVTAQATKQEAEAIQENIDKIDSILKKFRSAESVTSVESKTLQKTASALTRYQAQEIGSEVECIGGLPKISTNNGTQACPNPEKYLVESIDGLNSAGFSIPDSLTGSLVNAASGIEDTSAISASTQNAFDSLGTAANAIHKKAETALKKTMNRIDGEGNAKGEKTNDLISAFGKGFNNLNKKAGGSGGLMSALPYLSNSANKNNSDEESDVVAGQQGGLSATVNGGTRIGAIKTPKSNGFKFKFGQEDADNYAAQKHAEFDATADAVADMEDSGEGEIIEDKNVDIWKVISVRYKKTAYDRLLKRIE